MQFQFFECYGGCGYFVGFSVQIYFSLFSDLLCHFTGIKFIDKITLVENSRFFLGANLETRQIRLVE